MGYFEEEKNASKKQLTALTNYIIFLRMFKLLFIIDFKIVPWYINFGRILQRLQAFVFLSVAFPDSDEMQT